MKKNARILLLAATVAAAPSLSHAGGFDLTTQPMDILFEEGNYIEGTFGVVFPDVEGSTESSPFLPPSVTGDFGNVGERLPFITAGAKANLTDRISGAILFDTPFFRDTSYEAGIYAGTAAEVEAQTITAVGRFKFNENFSVYGGPRFQISSIDLQGPFASGTTFPTYQIDVKDQAFGFVVGAAAEIPEYKVRAAITYNSEITHDFDSQEIFATAGGPVVVPGSVDVHTPQSVNLDLQGPISTSTLVKANIRWADWGGVDFTPPGFLASTGRPVVEYTEDTITYRLTVAQRLTDNLAAFVTGSYEEDGGEDISLFKTVDGGISLGGGIVLQNEGGVRVQLAGEYRWLEGTSGLQIPNLPGTTLPPPASSFDASAFAFSMKVGYSF